MADSDSTNRRTLSNVADDLDTIQHTLATLNDITNETAFEWSVFDSVESVRTMVERIAVLTNVTGTRLNVLSKLVSELNKFSISDAHQVSQ